MSFGPETFKLWLIKGGLLSLDYSFFESIAVLKCISIRRGITIVFFLTGVILIRILILECININYYWNLMQIIGLEMYKF